MDPNLFAIDGERLLEVLGGIVILSMFIERSLSLAFEHRWFMPFVEKGVKEPIAFAVSFAVCRYWDFDALSIVFVQEHTQFWGHLLTAGIVAGGSKGAMQCVFRPIVIGDFAAS